MHICKGNKQSYSSQRHETGVFENRVKGSNIYKQNFISFGWRACMYINNVMIWVVQSVADAASLFEYFIFCLLRKVRFILYHNLTACFSGIVHEPGTVELRRQDPNSILLMLCILHFFIQLIGMFPKTWRHHYHYAPSMLFVYIWVKVQYNSSNIVL